MSDKLRWGILATARIAGIFARGLAHSRTGQLLAIGSRSKETAEKFAREFACPRAYGSYEELLADADVDAVYIATPHPMHAEWAIKAAEAHKHVLCEKPLTLNHAEAMGVIEAAIANDVFLMEAYMYRCCPQTARLVELLARKVIGEVRLIKCAFSFSGEFPPGHRLMSNALGGGGILDVGGYPVSMARLIAGVATGVDFAEPVELNGLAHLGDTGVDEWAVASLRFPGDILALLSTGVQLDQDNVVQIFGTKGNIVMPSPWIPAAEGGTTRIVVTENGRDVREIPIDTDQWLYGIEADTVAANIDRRQAASPAMTWNDTLGNMKTLDWWRESVALVYDRERPAAVGTLDGRPLTVPKMPKVSKDNPMKYGRIEGLEKPLSRLVMGVDNQRTMPHAAVMFDDFFRRGGNCFDTAHIYGGGTCEKLLGQWIANRGVRGDVVVLDKGAHTPHCTPEGLTSQLLESLDRLRIDRIDVYLMHRDNADVPVEEFIDLLNEHKSAGRIGVFGVSNWTIRRIEAANEYAASRGLAGISAVSNNFSLARMIQPVWDGCIAASAPESRAWFRRTQTPLMAWSSQARGFFTGRGDPDDRSDAELVRCWHGDDNFRRRERAIELARKRGVQPVAIALAYVLSQPFPTFALIGPRTLAETRTSTEALSIELSPEELDWLNLED